MLDNEQRRIALLLGRRAAEHIINKAVDYLQIDSYATEDDAMEAKIDFLEAVLEGMSENWLYPFKDLDA